MARVVALSGGYSRDEANERLARNPGLIASFSRALLDGLTAQQGDEEFDAALIGVAPGGSTVAEFAIPDTSSNEEFVGKTARFEIEVHEIGTIARIVQQVRLPDGSLRLLVEGEERVRVRRNTPASRLARTVSDVVMVVSPVRTICRTP